MNELIKNWPSVVLAMAGIAAAIATYAASKKADEQQKVIKNLGIVNRDLTVEVKKLGELNVTISETNNRLAIESKTLIEEVKKLTTNSEVLIKTINSNTDEALANAQRLRNPLFPMRLFIGIRIPFSNGQISPELIESFYALKHNIEKGDMYDKNHIHVNSTPDGEVITMEIDKIQIFPNASPSLHFLGMKFIDIKLLTTPNASKRGSNTTEVIFEGHTAINPLEMLSGQSTITIDFKFGALFVRTDYDNVILNYPGQLIPFGVTDLSGRYLQIKPRDLSNYEIYSFGISGDNSTLGYTLSYQVTQEDKKVHEGETYHIHKIVPPDIKTRVRRIRP